MKSITKKLFIAVLTLGLALIASVGSTYAWFSMNTKVTASGMSVTAKSDSAALVICTGTEFNNAVTTYSVNATNPNVELFPVAHGTVTDGTGEATDITDAGDMNDESKWYYAYSSNNAVSTAENGSAVACTSLGNYLGKSTFFVGLNDKSADTAKGVDLGVSKVTFGANNAITVVVVCGDNVHTFTASNEAVTGKILAEEVTTNGVQVDVYYFIDGNNAAVYTNNIESLTGSIVLDFKIASISNS